MKSNEDLVLTDILEEFNDEDQAIEWLLDQTTEHNLIFHNNSIDEFCLRSRNLKFSDHHHEALLSIANSRNSYALIKFINLGLDPTIARPKISWKNTLVTIIEQAAEDHLEADTLMLYHALSAKGIKEKLLSHDLSEVNHMIYDEMLERLSTREINCINFKKLVPQHDRTKSPEERGRPLSNPFILYKNHLQKSLSSTPDTPDESISEIPKSNPQSPSCNTGCFPSIRGIFTRR